MRLARSFLPLLTCITLLAAVGCNRTLIVQADAGTQQQQQRDAEVGNIAGTGAPSADAAVPGPDAAPIDIPEGCPTEPADNGGACGVVNEGIVCSYFYDDPSDAAQSIYSECTCIAGCADASTPHWNCHGVISPHMDCPATQPKDGSSCFGMKGQECNYPIQRTCTCPSKAGDDAWRCKVDNGVNMPAPPASIDDRLQVRDLSDADRETWCEWFEWPDPKPGFPANPEQIADADGYSSGDSCFATREICSVTGPSDFPASACVANLKLSACMAPLAELNACLMWMRGTAGATRGCAHYLHAFGCDGTIVKSTGSDRPAEGDPVFSDCKIRIERRD